MQHICDLISNVIEFARQIVTCNLYVYHPNPSCSIEDNYSKYQFAEVLACSAQTGSKLTRFYCTPYSG